MADSLICRLSQKLLFGGEHLKQKSVNKFLASVHRFVCHKCYEAEHLHHLFTTENQGFTSYQNEEKIFCGRSAMA